MPQIKSQDEMKTIWISHANQDAINQIKEHPKITNDVILSRLIEFWNKYKDVVQESKN